MKWLYDLTREARSDLHGPTCTARPARPDLRGPTVFIQVIRQRRQDHDAKTH